MSVTRARAAGRKATMLHDYRKQAGSLISSKTVTLVVTSASSGNSLIGLSGLDERSRRAID